MKQFALLALVALTALSEQVEGGLAREKKDYDNYEYDQEVCGYTKIDPGFVCPQSNYPALHNVAGARSEEQAIERILQGTPATYCTELTSYGTCLLSAAEAIPSQCRWMYRRAQQAIPVYSQVYQIMKDVCANDIHTITDNFRCLVNAQRIDDGRVCFREVYPMTPEPYDPNVNYCETNVKREADLAYCIVNKIRADTNCTADVADVLNRVVGQVYNVVLPICANDNHNEFADKEFSTRLNFLRLF